MSLLNNVKNIQKFQISFTGTATVADAVLAEVVIANCFVTGLSFSTSLATGLDDTSWSYDINTTTNIRFARIGNTSMTAIISGYVIELNGFG